MITLRLGTRGSALARWQAQYVAGRLQAAWPDVQVEIVIVTTRGDKTLDTPLHQLEGKGAFTEELEAALRSGELDCAVHSLKDLPTAQPDGLTIGAVPPRGSAQDVLISRDGYTLETLPAGATVGTDSPRRAAQLLHYQPDIQITHIRGNIDTRINKALAADSPYTAIVLAQAGLERLGKMEAATQTLSLEQVLPAPGQGALAVQCRDEAESLKWFAPVNHRETHLAVTAERALLAGLGGGCALPVAAYAQFANEQFHLIGRVCSADGRIRIDNELMLQGDITIEAVERAGRRLAQRALARSGEWMAS